MDYITRIAHEYHMREEEKIYRAHLERKKRWQFAKWSAWLTFFLMLMLTALAFNSKAFAFEIDIDKIVMIESSGNPDAYNRRSGCIGLMQINPQAAMLDFNYYHSKQFTRQDLFDPQINIRIGKWYISERIPTMLRHYGIPVTEETVIASYNWGIGHVKKWHKRGMIFAELPTETQNYIIKYRGIK